MAQTPAAHRFDSFDETMHAVRGGSCPTGGVRAAVGKWPAGATVESLAQAGHLSTAVVIADLR